MIKCPNAQRLYEDLHRQISQQDLLPGTAIPSENELAERYSISRPTVRKMLGRLCDSGLLERRMGKGTFVTERNRHNESGPDRPFMIGTDSIGRNNFYYSEIALTMRTSPYGKHIYLNMLDPEESVRGKVPEPVDALLFVRELLPENAYRAFARKRLPVAHINRKCEYPEVGYITVDHEAEAERAVSLLLHSGHRRVALFAKITDTYSESVVLRARGWKNACRKNLHEIPRELVNPVLPESPADFDAWLDRLRPDAFFFVTMAQYDAFRLDYARCTGRTPEDLCTIVFDDMDAAFPERYPTVNFIRMPLSRMTCMGIEYLWRKMRNPALQPVREILPCDLILRTGI